jgi:hypothetical protein
MSGELRDSVLQIILPKTREKWGPSVYLSTRSGPPAKRSAIWREFLRSTRVGFTPGTKIYSIEPYAKYVGWNEAELRRLKADNANHSAVDCR